MAAKRTSSAVGCCGCFSGLGAAAPKAAPLPDGAAANDPTATFGALMRGCTVDAPMVITHPSGQTSPGGSPSRGFAVPLRPRQKNAAEVRSLRLLEEVCHRGETAKTMLEIRQPHVATHSILGNHAYGETCKYPLLGAEVQLSGKTVTLLPRREQPAPETRVDIMLGSEGAASGLAALFCLAAKAGLKKILLQTNGSLQVAGAGVAAGPSGAKKASTGPSSSRKAADVLREHETTLQELTTSRQKVQEARRARSQDPGPQSQPIQQSPAPESHSPRFAVRTRDIALTSVQQVTVDHEQQRTMRHLEDAEALMRALQRTRCVEPPAKADGVSPARIPSSRSQQAMLSPTSRGRQPLVAAGDVGFPATSNSRPCEEHTSINMSNMRSSLQPHSTLLEPDHLGCGGRPPVSAEHVGLSNMTNFVSTLRPHHTLSDTDRLPGPADDARSSTITKSAATGDTRPSKVPNVGNIHIPSDLPVWGEDIRVSKMPISQHQNMTADDVGVLSVSRVGQTTSPMMPGSGNAEEVDVGTLRMSSLQRAMPAIPTLPEASGHWDNKVRSSILSPRAQRNTNSSSHSFGDTSNLSPRAQHVGFAATLPLTTGRLPEPTPDAMRHDLPSMRGVEQHASPGPLRRSDANEQRSPRGVGQSASPGPRGRELERPATPQPRRRDNVAASPVTGEDMGHFGTLFQATSGISEPAMDSR